MAEIFTRGQPGDLDKRGESMVQKHAEKMAAEKETQALEKLNALLPQIGLAAKVHALQETQWNVDEALMMLRRFLSANMEKLSALHKKRKRLQAEGHAKAGSGQSSDESSDDERQGSSSSSSGSEDSADEGRKKARSKSRDRSKSRERVKKRSSKDKKKHSSKSKKKKRSKHKERKERKASKKEVVSVGGDYGKFGIIRETDFFAKRPEFILWAMEVKGVEVDLMPKFEERELFKEYMEDFNTGTLKHRKFYDLDAYERQQAARQAKKAAKKGEQPPRERAAFNDEEEMAKQRAAEREAAAAERLRAAYVEMKMGGKAKDMRDQELLRMQMTLAYKTGDMAKAQKLMERLAPDDKKKDEPPRLGVTEVAPTK